MLEMPRQLDITKPKLPVIVEYDQHRNVLYVHVDGYTTLRICRMPGIVEFIKNGETVFLEGAK